MNSDIKKELKKHVIDQVEKTFRVMFNLQVHHTDDFLFRFNEDDLVTKAEMQQDGLGLTLRFVFPRSLLKPLLLTLYLPALATHEMAYEDAACEIANIVCTGVKSFLNQNGYKLAMNIPRIDYGPVEKISAKEVDTHLNINFVLNEDGFSVDLVMIDKTKGIENRINI